MTGGSENSKKKMVEAVGRILSRDGYQALGVNRVAREAGLDKVLIYRYFGGLSGLVVEFARHPDFWPSKDEIIGNPAMVAEMTSGQKVSLFFKEFMNGLRKRPQTCAVLAWEAMERNDVTRLLEEERIRISLECFEALDVEIDEAVDFPAVMVLMSGAIVRLILRSRLAGAAGGVDLESDEGWARLERAIDALVSCALDPAVW